ncbi:MAG: FHA domain-containing protein [Pirellulaceae bacterium]|nr:FHA domain-containing protein [Pirellulaceae bacterium]
MSLNAKLVVVGGEVKTAEIKLRLPSTIGRGRGATIMLPHPLVSRQHCELFEAGGQLMVRDLGSLNGTFVKNERIAGDAALPPGELLTVGAVTFRAVYEVEESNAPPPGEGPQLKSGPAGAVDPHGTVRTGGKTVTSSPKPQLLEEDDDAGFNFDEPLIPVDEDAAPLANAHTDPVGPPSSQATLRDNSKPASKPAGKPAGGKGSSVAMQGKTSSPNSVAPAKGNAPSKAAPPAKSAATAPAPAKAPPAKPAAGGDEKTINQNKWQDDEEPIEGTGEDDEDFGDFLKSLDNQK